MSFPFLSLPIELRFQIYKLLVGPGGGISNKGLLDLLLSCRQISAEAAQFFYNNCSLRMFASHNETVNDTLNIMGARNRSFMRRLEIDWAAGTWKVGVRSIENLISKTYEETGSTPFWLRAAVQGFLAEYNAEVITSLRLVESCGSLRELTLLFQNHYRKEESSHVIKFFTEDHFLHAEVRRALVAIKGISVLTIGYTVNLKGVLALAEEMGVRQRLEVIWWGGDISEFGRGFAKCIEAFMEEGWKFDFGGHGLNGWDMAWKKMAGPPPRYPNA